MEPQLEPGSTNAFTFSRDLARIEFGRPGAPVPVLEPDAMVEIQRRVNAVRYPNGRAVHEQAQAQALAPEPEVDNDTDYDYIEDDFDYDDD